jgi:hypothetical protein
VIVADAMVNKIVASDEARPRLARRTLIGGGGTDHRPLFAPIAERRSARCVHRADQSRVCVSGAGAALPGVVVPSTARRRGGGWWRFSRRVRWTGECT